MNYQKKILLAAVIAASYALTGCGNSKSASQVAEDTSAAERKAVDNTAKVQQKADARIASARGDVRDEQRDLAHVDAVESQKLADAQADGDYKVALARCESLGGANQKACHDQASADYDVAKARAKQDKAHDDPKP